MLSAAMTEAGAPAEWVAKAQQLEQRAAMGDALLAGLDHVEGAISAVRRVVTGDSIAVLIEEESPPSGG